MPSAPAAGARRVSLCAQQTLRPLMQRARAVVVDVHLLSVLIRAPAGRRACFLALVWQPGTSRGSVARVASPVPAFCVTASRVRRDQTVLDPRIKEIGRASCRERV